MPGEESTKLIIDTDWKAQAQAEKERLAQKSKPAQPKAPAAIGPADMHADTEDDEHASPGSPPRQVGFKDLVSILISQALAYMGAYPDPRTGQAVVALDLAKLHIDLLAVLETKTKGNLAPDEATLLSRALNELRLEYVDVAKMVNKAVEEGRATTIGPGGVMQPPSAAPATAPKLNFPDLRNPR